MKIKGKSKKVHPLPTTSPYTAANLSFATGHDSLSALNLLPAAILTLITALTLQDREVLAYMITRSLKSTNAAICSGNSPSVYKHNCPVFDCECFGCYKSFWTRWDSSPNCEVIHQAIEAFEEHLASGELEFKRSNSNSRKGKKKDKVVEKVEIVKSTKLVVGNGASELGEEDSVAESEVKTMSFDDVEADRGVVVKGEGHRGYARKVLPDVLGVFNSRIWNLWGPNL